MRYYTRGRPPGERVRYGTTPDVVAVFRAPDDPMPIGVARCIGITSEDLALWHLSVGGYDLTGWFVIEDHRFVRIR